MTIYKEDHHFHYSKEQCFALVADVEHYPDFLPWCTAARILERGDTELKAELLIKFKAFREKYTSHVFLEREKEDPWRIDVELIEGPFHHLSNIWEFTSLPDGTTNIHFFIDFQFKSGMLDKMIGALFEKAVHKMVTAFEHRAEELYG